VRIGKRKRNIQKPKTPPPPHRKKKKTKKNIGSPSPNELLVRGILPYGGNANNSSRKGKIHPRSYEKETRRGQGKPTVKKGTRKCSGDSPGAKMELYGSPAKRK